MYEDDYIYDLTEKETYKSLISSCRDLAIKNFIISYHSSKTVYDKNKAISELNISDDVLNEWRKFIVDRDVKYFLKIHSRDGKIAEHTLTKVVCDMSLFVYEQIMNACVDNGTHVLAWEPIAKDFIYIRIKTKRSKIK